MIMKQQFISESCSWFHSSSNFQISTLIEMFNLSGIGINRLGDFRDCLQQPHLKYFLFSYQLPSVQNQFLTGVCSSANCTANDLAFIANNLNLYNPAPYRQLEILQINGTSMEWNACSIIFCCLLALYMAICLVMGAIELYKKEKRLARRKIVQILSFLHSYQIMIQRRSNNHRLKILTGLRALAFISMTIFNTGSVLLKAPTFQINSTLVSNLSIFYFSFDLWLYVGAFYLAFHFSRNYHKTQNCRFILPYLIAKVIKVLFINIILDCVIRLIFFSMGSGPLWTLLMNDFANECSFDIFRFLLVSNITGGCDYWIWIFSLELQMAIVCSLLFVILNSPYRFRMLLFIGIQVVFVGCGFLGVYLRKDKHQVLNFDIFEDSTGKFPITRGVASLIGFNMGYWYYDFRIHKNKDKLIVIKIFQKTVVRILIPVIGIGCVGFCWFYCSTKFVGDQIKYVVQAFHTLIPIAVTLIISSSIFGFKGPIYYFFNNRLFSIISRLSFSAYSVQYISVIFTTFSRNQDIYVNLSRLLVDTSCGLLISLLCGLLFCLFFEIPLHKSLLIFSGDSGNKYIDFQ